MPAQLQKFLQVGDVEISNGWRIDAYVRAGLVEGWEPGWCFDDNLLNAVPDFGFANPVTDPAPWYDPLDDDSLHFFGVAIRSFTSEVPVERVGMSTRRIGRLQTKLRRFVLEADLLADDCCGTDYGKRWLLAQFEAGCLPGCATLDAVLAVCGRSDDEVDRMRNVYSMGLVSFEDITPAGQNCCFGATVRVVFNAENPWLYGPSIPALVFEGWDLTTPVENVDCVPWDDCPEPTESPCATPVGSTIAPPPLPSLAGPLAPGGQAVPWCNPTFEANQCVFVEAPTVLGEAVLRITLDAGPNGNMDNARVRIFESGIVEADCNNQDFGNSPPITELRIARIPQDGTLVIDGSTRSILLYCPDINPLTGVAFGWINADHLIYGPNSAFWQHPVLGCGSGPFCVCATVDAENTGGEAGLTVEVIPRYL
jgi:hypothetical protein